MVDDRLYDWMRNNSDGDGLVETSTYSLAPAIGCPPRTLQYALRRLEAKGKIAVIGRMKFVVVDKAGVDDL